MIGRIFRLLETIFKEDRGSRSSQDELPLGVQNYIDNKVHDAVSRINEETKHQLRDLVKEKFRWWDKAQNWFSLIGIALGLFSILGMKEFLRKRAEQSAMEYLTTNIVHQAMMDTFRSNVAKFTQNQLQPLQQQVLDTSNMVVSIRREITRDQLALQKRVRLQEAYLGARIGNRLDYHELNRFCEENGDVGLLARGARDEVARFYANYLRSPERSAIVDGISLKPVVSSVEEMITFLSSPDSGNRIAAATALKELRRSNTVASICGHLKVETNLFVSIHLLQALKDITSESFDSLDFGYVERWWASNQTNNAFKAPYEEFLQVAHPTSGNPLTDNSVILLRVSDELISVEPNACEARLFRGRTLLNGRLLKEVEAEIEQINKRLPNYRGILELKMELFFRQTKTNECVAVMNDLFDISPSSAESYLTIRSRNFFGDFLNDPCIKWPPHIKQNKQTPLRN